MWIIGADCKIFWTSVRLLGSLNDACIIRTFLYQNIVRNDFLPEIQKVVKLPNGNKFPPISLEDSAFPHHIWLQKPFANKTASWKQLHFNYCLSKARMVIECAFGQLRERWLLLHRKSEANQHSFIVNILNCILLHNICIENGDSISCKLDLSND